MSTASNAAWLTVCRLLGEALSFLLFVAISRRFGPGGAGAYAYGFAVARLISLGGQLGMDEYGIREYARLPAAQTRPLLGLLVSTQLILSGLAALALAGYLAVSRPGWEAAAVIMVLSSYMLATALARTLFVPAYAQQAMAGPAVADLACRAGAIAVALVAMMALRAPIFVSLIPFPVSALVLTGIAALSAHRRAGAWRVSTSWRGIAATARSVWPFAATEAVSQLYARADLILISLLVGEAAAGIYTSGFKFVEVGVMPLGFISLAVYPLLSRSFEPDPPRFSALATDLLKGTLFLGGLLAWGLFFIVPGVIVPLFGERFAGAEPIVQMMAGLALCQAAEAALLRVMLAAHRQVALFRGLVLGTALNVGLNLILIPLFGIRGAAAAWITTLGVLDVVYARALREYLPTQVLLAVLGACGASVGGAAAVSLLIGRFSGATWVQAAVALIVFVVLAAVTGLLPPGRPETFVWRSILWGRRQREDVEP